MDHPLHRTGAGAVLLLATGKMLERHIIEVKLALAGDAEYWASGDLNSQLLLAALHFPVSSKWDRLAAANVSSSIVE